MKTNERETHHRGLSAERSGGSWRPQWPGEQSNTRWRPIARLVIMRNICFLAVIVLELAQSVLAVDNTWDYAVLVSAAVQTSPPQITLRWSQDTVAGPDSYTVYRKSVSAASWGTGTVLPGAVTSFTGNNVAVGASYEYQIFKTNAAYHSSGYGYLYAGLNAPMVENRGKVVLMVDNTYAMELANELGRLKQDLLGDGWTVLAHG